MKIYKLYFAVLTLAQVVFTLTWFLFIKKFDRVIVLSLMIYIAAMLIGYVTYEIEKYRRKRKELIDNLP